MLHLITCHWCIMPRLAELLLLLLCFIEVPIFNVNSVDPDQMVSQLKWVNYMKCPHKTTLCQKQVTNILSLLASVSKFYISG